MRNKVYLVLSMIALSTSAFAQTTDSVCINELQQQNRALQEQLTKLEQRTQELAMQVALLNQENDSMLQQINKLKEQEKDV